MNDLTRKVLTLLLADEKSWDYGTRKAPKQPPELRYSHVVDGLIRGREYLYMQDVFWPGYFRMVQLMRLILPESCFLWWDDAEHWMIDDEGLQLIASEHFEHYLDWFLCHHPEWDFEEPTRAEVLALATPPLKKGQMVFQLEGI